MAHVDPIENQSYIYSGILHFIVLMIGIFGLPEFWESHRESLPVAMTVEVLPIGQTNIKPQEASKRTVKKNKPKPTAKPKATPKPKPEPKKEAVPLPKKEAEKPKPKKEQPKPKPEPKKEEVVKKPEPEMDLSDILRSVEQAAQGDTETANTQTSQDTKKAISDNYNPSLPMAMSEIDAIRQQIIRNWNIPAGAKDAYQLIIVLSVQLSPGGEVLNVGLAENKTRYYSDNFFRAAADSAIRAVRRSSPLQNLPTDKYDTWKDLELSFDPKEVLF